MKKTALLLLTLVSSFMVNAAKLPPKEAMLSASFVEYQKLLTGFFINKHCGFIDEEASKKFEHDLATIASKLRKDSGDSKMLTYKLSEAKKQAQETQFQACGATAKQTFSYSLENAVTWSTNIKRSMSKNTNKP